MNAGVKNRASARSISRPSLPALWNGAWRFLWLGDLRPSAENPSGYEVQAHFEWAAGGYRNPIVIWPSLSQLDVLVLQSRWENKVFSGFPPGEDLVVRVLTDGAALRDPWMPGRPEMDVLTRDDYSFRGISDLARCWIFKTTHPEGELVVPVWEVLRAWYLFDGHCMPSVLAGIRHADRIRRDLRPFLSQTGWLEDGTPQYAAPRWLSAESMKRMARLVFDPVANDRAYDIYRQLMASAGSSSDGVIPMPAVLPPYDGEAEWTLLAQPLAAASNGVPRWLALRLRRAVVSDSISRVHYVQELDNRQGQNWDDPSLPVKRWRRQGPALLPNPLPLTGTGPDTGLEDAVIDEFGFEDSIVDTLQATRSEKLLQVARSVHLPANPTPIEGVGTDRAAKPRRRHAGLSTGGDEPEDPPADLMERTLGAFKALIRATRERTSVTAAAKLLTRNGSETFRVLALDGRRRHFAILEAELTGRFAYVLDAQRFGSESFKMVMCRSADYRAIPDFRFQYWLRHFPSRDGDPWTGGEATPHGWIFETIVHQPERKHLTKQEVTSQLVARLERRLTAFTGLA